MRCVVTIKDHNAMRALRANGASIADLENLFPRYGHTTIHSHVKDIPAPPSGWKRSGARRKVDGAKIYQLRRRDGLTYAAIAKRFGVTQTCAWYAVKRYKQEQAA